MSVTTDLQASHKALNVELQEKLARALSEAERVTALLANAVALHGLYLKYRPFQGELTASGAWLIVTDGEEFAQSSVPSFLKVIEVQLRADALLDGKAKIMTSSDDKGPWDETMEFLRNLLENLKENWDHGIEAVERFRDDFRDWSKSQMDHLKHEIDNFGKDDPQH